MTADSSLTTPLHTISSVPASKRRLWLIRVSIVVICYTLMCLYTVHWTRSAFGYAWDFNIYYEKAAAAQTGQSPYLPYFVSTSFLSHPVVLSLLSLFTRVSEPVGYALWTAASLIAYAASIFLIYRLHTGGRSLPRGKVLFIAILLIAFGPLWEATHLGQINAFTTLCLTLSLHNSEHDQPIWSGIFLGLAILLKTSPALFILYFLALRRPRVVLAAIVTVLALSVLAYLQYGPGVYVDFFSILPRLASETHAGYLLNMGAPIITSRLLSLIQISGDSAEAVVALVYKVLFGGATLALLIYAAFNQPTRHSPAARRWLFGILTILMVISSPVVWFHHNVFLVIPLIMILVDRFGQGLAILLLMQSERLIYNVMFASFGASSDAMADTVTRLTAGVPTILAQLALLGALLWIYLRQTSTARQAFETGSALT